MTLSDHLRPLLRDHDCVIIPDFGGLVAEYSPARVQLGGRHLLLPPTRQVAFNQALTRNDGLLVDALREHLSLPTAEAREAVRQAVAALHHDLRAQQRAELPGIGVFRQVAGRGLQFEYTGTDNMLAAAFGLPELLAHPVRATDVRLAREQQAQLVPRLRSAGSGLRLRRLVPGAVVGLLAGLTVAGLYLANLHPALVPVAWRGYVPRWEMPAQSIEPQQATLGRTSMGQPVVAPTHVATVPVVATPAAPLASEWSAAADTALKEATITAIPVETLTPVTNASTASAVSMLPAATVPANLTPAKVVAATPTLAAPTVAKAPVLAKKAAWKPAAPLAKGTKPLLRPTVVLAGATTIKARTGRYYIIVGAYSSLASAEKGRQMLAKTGRAAKVILPYWGTRHFRVSAADFADLPSANVTAERLRKNPNFDKGLSILPY